MGMVVIWFVASNCSERIAINQLSYSSDRLWAHDIGLSGSQYVECKQRLDANRISHVVQATSLTKHCEALYHREDGSLACITPCLSRVAKYTQAAKATQSPAVVAEMVDRRLWKLPSFLMNHIPPFVAGMLVPSSVLP